MSKHNSIDDTFDELGLEIVATHQLAGDPPSYAPCPATCSEATRAYLRRAYPAGLYRHQALALDALAQGHDVCLETPTASGKTLVFHSAAHDVLARNPNAKVLVLYPARALIEDQLQKWAGAVEGTDLRVGRIHGDVPMAHRTTVLAKSSVVLMTPDVLHAWLMSRLGDEAVRRFLGDVELLVLDEAHAYDAVFGSNMAYLVRRLDVAIHACACAVRARRPFAVLSATATLGEPGSFIERLTGRPATLIGADQDGSERHPKRIVAVRVESSLLQSAVRIVRALANGAAGRFVAFADSRRMVEQLCAKTLREDAALTNVIDPGGADEATPNDEAILARVDAAVLPYRSGYEDGDRVRIQQALSEGRLRGVISTSALELGIDIGEIDTVLCIGLPPSMKAFWQRIGRAGRKGPATCLILGDARLPEDDDALAAFLATPLEPNWLYLDNRYLQFGQALCAARELSDLGVRVADAAAFATLPKAFSSHVDNELDPREPIPQDLFPLKQRCAVSAPQYAFPLRSAAEENLEIHLRNGARMGEVTFSQSLREAYPGGVYMHFAKAHRVVAFNLRQGRIEVQRCPYASTRPILQNTIFPKFGGGIIDARTSPRGFVAEVALQVSERLLGFVEVRGLKREQHDYGPGSRYAQLPISRFFESTGICLWFDDLDAKAVEAVANAVVAAGCARFGLHPRDVGCERFHAQRAFARSGPIRGVCIYDTTWGSLRLTTRFFSELPSLLEDLRAHPPEAFGGATLVPTIDRLLELIAECAPEPALAPLADGFRVPVANDTQALHVIATGSKGMLRTGLTVEEVEVAGVIYTPNGAMYRVAGPTTRLVAVACVEPIVGVSQMQAFDPATYGLEDLGLAG